MRILCYTCIQDTAYSFSAVYVSVRGYCPHPCVARFAVRHVQLQMLAGTSSLHLKQSPRSAQATAEAMPDEERKAK